MTRVVVWSRLARSKRFGGCLGRRAKSTVAKNDARGIGSEYDVAGGPLSVLVCSGHTEIKIGDLDFYHLPPPCNVYLRVGSSRGPYRNIAPKPPEPEIVDIWDFRWSTTGGENEKSKMCPLKYVTMMRERTLIGYNTQRVPTAPAPCCRNFPKNRTSPHAYGVPLSIPQHILAPWNYSSCARSSHSTSFHKWSDVSFLIPAPQISFFNARRARLTRDG